MTIVIALISLILLLIIHEFGHFIVAKKFGVKVEEFGIGYPPRLFGKKMGETLYSINLIPFGAFVKMPGEVEHSDDPRSFFRKPVWQRALIVVAGVVSFWIVAAVIFSIVMVIGVPTAVPDTETLAGAKVQITGISPDSPAELAGIKAGDFVVFAKSEESETEINNVAGLVEFTDLNKGREVILTIERGQETFDVSLEPRLSPPAGQGPLGVSLIRVALQQFSWWKAPWEGIKATFNMTLAIIQGYSQAISNLIKGEPTGVQLTGPVGIISLFGQFSKLGVSYFLQFVAMISLYVAIFNILPIPSVDGGKLLFLGIEALRKKPVNQKIEQGVTTVFFALLILVMIAVTIKDVINLI